MSGRPPLTGTAPASTTRSLRQRPTKVPRPARWLLAITLVLAAHGRHAEADDAVPVRVLARSGHPKVVLAERPATTSATMYIDLAVGSVDDGTSLGLTRLTQLAVLATGYEQLQQGVYAAGGELHIYTEHQRASYVLTAPPSEVEALARRLVGLVLSPKLSAASLEHGKALAVQRSDQETESMFAGFLAQTAVSKDGFAEDPAGDSETIRGIELPAVRAHAARYFVPANATIVVAGAFPARLGAALAAPSGGKRRTYPPLRESLAGDYKLASYIELHLLAYPVALSGTREAAAAHVARALIGDRVQRAFRRRGVAYTSLTSIVRRPWLDFLLIVLPIRTDPAVPVAEYLKAEVDRVRAEPLGEDLNTAQSEALAWLSSLDHTPELLAATLSASGGDTTWIGRDVRTAISTLTEAELTSTLGPALARERSIHLLASPKGGH